MTQGGKGAHQKYSCSFDVQVLKHVSHYSLSTTVSLFLISAMAFTRHQVVASSLSQHRIFLWSTRHPLLATILPWIVGVVFTSLHFLDIFTMTITFQVRKR